MLTCLFDSVGDAASARSAAVETRAVDYHASTVRTLVSTHAFSSGYDNPLPMLKLSGRDFARTIRTQSFLHPGLYPDNHLT